MKGIISSQNRRMILLCSGRLYIAALRIFLIDPGARHRYQRHLDRRREVPPWLAWFRQERAWSLLRLRWPLKAHRGSESVRVGRTDVVDTPAAQSRFLLTKRTETLYNKVLHGYENRPTRHGNLRTLLHVGSDL